MSDILTTVMAIGLGVLVAVVFVAVLWLSITSFIARRMAKDICRIIDRGEYDVTYADRVWVRGRWVRETDYRVGPYRLEIDDDFVIVSRIGSKERYLPNIKRGPFPARRIIRAFERYEAEHPGKARKCKARSRRY